METETGELLKKKSPLDEVDFTSGYEKQYEEEYRPLKPAKIAPADPKRAWYRHLDTIIMVLFLASIFICGSVALITKVFGTSLLSMLVILGLYIVVALIFVLLEINSKYVQ